jgi:hypothetical protein
VPDTPKIREWFVLQGRIKADWEDPATGALVLAGTWRDEMSLVSFRLPESREAALADFRCPELDDDPYPHPCDQWRFVRRTEEILDD